MATGNSSPSSPSKTKGGSAFLKPVKGGEEKVTLLSKSSDCDPETAKLLSYIFKPDERSDVFNYGGARKKLDFSNLADYLGDHLRTIVEQKVGSDDTAFRKDDCCRLGPENVVFDFKGNMGTLLIEADRLGLSSQSNFSSIRANTCVYKGKWIYELMLGSRGVMQVGWCTAHCAFTQEEGVGDTADSYAFDGNRIRKWNFKTPQKYGEAWLTGDVITCAIDCDEGSVSFFRNGKNLGEAFSNLSIGPGYAYFPAVSLSLAENIRANFGATPLRYPVNDYRALQDPPTIDLIKSCELFGYLERVVPLMIEADELDVPILDMTVVAGAYTASRSKKATLLLATAHIFEELAPLMKTSYVVEAGLLKFLLQCCEVTEVCGEHLLIQKSLDIIWSLMQESEQKLCLEHLMASLVSAYRFSPATADFAYQLTFLVLTYAILKHERTRKYLLKHVLFDKIKFMTFLHIKPPDDEGLAEIISDVCLDLGDRESDEDEPADPPSQETLEKRKIYFDSCNDLKLRIDELEYLQVEILKLLLLNNDNSQGGGSTRFIFLHKFRDFLQTNLPQTRLNITLVNQCPLSVCLCLFHRLIRAIRCYWDDYYEHNSGQSVVSNEAYVPCKIFYGDNVNYFEIQRLGGLLSHLKKTHKDELLSTSTASQSYAGSEDISCHSLVELLDGAFLLYNMAAHKQLSKMSTLRKTLHEYVDAFDDSCRKIESCPEELGLVRKELERSKKVFRDRGVEQVRQMAWVIAGIYAQEKQEDIYWLLQVLLRTINKASNCGKLFSFVPDFYVEACINSFHALQTYFHPTRPYHNLPGYSEVLSQFATFLGEHFGDDRIVNADCKDTLIQALANFVCFPHSLRALENIALNSQIKMMKGLLAPYENRSWAQTNWILVRLWKGCGFGFRYTNLPHLTPLKGAHPDHIVPHVRKPCPSLIIQQHICDVLRADENAACKFLDSVLNQLNWAFSEFIGMLQELQSIAARPTAAFIDSRHLKICATCFDISVGLLRLIEMITSLVPQFFTDWSKPCSEQFLCRLYQILTQILNRITSKTNTFDMIVAANIPGLESVEHYPILAAVYGIFMQLLLTGSETSQKCATLALLAEPGFQMSCLEFLIGGATTSLPGQNKFSFTNYHGSVNDAELASVKQLIQYLLEQQNRQQKTLSVDEDSLCEICYARPKSVKFVPCNHLSCKSCITHQMMNKKECFFCKAIIKDVRDL